MKPSYGRSPGASAALWWTEQEMTATRAQSGAGRLCTHEGGADGRKGQPKRDVCVGEEKQNGEEMNAHQHARVCVCCGVKGRTREKKQLVKRTQDEKQSDLTYSSGM